MGHPSFRAHSEHVRRKLTDCMKHTPVHLGLTCSPLLDCYGRKDPLFHTESSSGALVIGLLDLICFHRA